MSDVTLLMERWRAMPRVSDPAMELPPTPESRFGYEKAFEMYGVDGKATVDSLVTVMNIKNELRRYFDNMVPDVRNEMQPNERQVAFFKAKMLQDVTDAEMNEFMRLSRQQAHDYLESQFDRGPGRAGSR